MITHCCQCFALLAEWQEGHPSCRKMGDGGGGHWLVRMECRGVVERERVGTPFSYIFLCGNSQSLYSNCCQNHPTCFLGPTRVHNPNGISTGSAIFAQLMAECCRACPGVTFPQNCPFAWGMWISWGMPFPLNIAPSHRDIWTPI